MPIVYAIEPDLTAEEFADVLVRSTLAARRPATDLPRLAKMLAQADIIITARDEQNRLVGISRAISDFSFCTYLSDLAVDVAYQRQGIGKILVHKTHEQAGLQTNLILLSAPQAKTYYPHIGMTPHDSCWMISGE